MRIWFLRLFHEFRYCNDVYESQKLSIKRQRDTILEYGKRIDAMQEKLTASERSAALTMDIRLNTERELSVIRGELDAMREQHIREVENFKQFVDFFAQGSVGRQVFGKLPPTEVPSGEIRDEPESISAREASRRLTEQFMDEMLAKGGQPPRDPSQDSVYSSVNRSGPQSDLAYSNNTYAAQQYQRADAT